MRKSFAKSYILDKAESLPPREIKKLQVERLRAGIERLSAPPANCAQLAGSSRSDVRLSRKARADFQKLARPVRTKLKA